jgi:hypothetical protein
MDEQRPRNSESRALIAGPDGRVYFVPKTGQPFVPGPAGLVHGPAGPVDSAGMRIPEAVRIRNDVRAKLGNLPQMPGVPC